MIKISISILPGKIVELTIGDETILLDEDELESLQFQVNITLQELDEKE